MDGFSIVATAALTGRRTVVLPLIRGADRSSGDAADGTADEGALAATTATGSKGADTGAGSCPSGCSPLGRSASDEGERAGEENLNE